jgi:hypothetical protein
MKPLEIDSFTDEALDELVSAAVGDNQQFALDALWSCVEQAEAVAVANQTIIAKAQVRANTALGEAARIKERILFQMQARGLKAVACSAGKFQAHANGGHQPLRITGEFGDEFARIKREADLDKIRQAIKEGEILPFVEVLDRGTHLRLK